MRMSRAPFMLQRFSYQFKSNFAGMKFVYLILACILSKCKLSNSVQINFVKVPSSVRNNTNKPIVLDCNYSVRPDDTDLVVKWFLNEEVIYQWIPPKKPQSLGVMKERLDLTYRISEDPKMAHRAMKILNPTTDIAGDYKCYVSTFADEDFSWKRMTVYEPERALTMIESTPSDLKINFTCIASETYPQPKVYLYKEKKEKDTVRNPLEAIEWDTVKHEEDGRYSTFTTSTAKLMELAPGDLIFCELRIPTTGYVKIKSMIYYPLEMTKWNDGANIVPNVMIIWILCAILEFI